MMLHVIDDSEIIRETTDAILSDAGYRVCCFESGNQYMQYLNSASFESPIAVISDISMPGISGYDLALAIRKVLPFQIIFFISGNAYCEHNKTAVQETCMVLNKPIHPEALLEKVRDVILPCHKHLSEKANNPRSTCVNAGLYDCPFCSRNLLT